MKTSELSSRAIGLLSNANAIGRRGGVDKKRLRSLFKSGEIKKYINCGRKTQTELKKLI